MAAATTAATVNPKCLNSGLGRAPNAPKRSMPMHARRACRRSATSRRSRRPRSTSRAPSGGQHLSRDTSAGCAVERLRARHRHDAHRDARTFERARRVDGELQPRSPWRSAMTAGALAARSARSRRARSSAICSACAARAAAPGASARGTSGRSLPLDGGASTPRPSRRCRTAARAIHVRHQPQARDVLDGLVRRAVFAEADGVVRAARRSLRRPHQRRHAHGVARVVGEHQERAAVRNEAAVQRRCRS